MGVPVPVRTASETASIPWWADAAVDVASACTAALAVSPFIMTIDKAIVESTAGKSSLGGAVLRGVASLLLRPHHVLMSPQYWMVAGVYAATYSPQT